MKILSLSVSWFTKSAFEIEIFLVSWNVFRNFDNKNEYKNEF